MAFNVATLGKNGAPVIEVTPLFMTDVPEFTVRGRGVRAAPSMRARSFVERAVSFPRTSRSKRPRPSQRRTSRRRRWRRPAPRAGGRASAPAARTGSATVLMHYSMVKLPEKPMMPRLLRRARRLLLHGDCDYGTDEHRAPRAPLHHPLPPGEEGPERGGLRAGEADRLLRRSGDAEEVGAVHEEGHRGLAAGVRGGRLQERDHREGSADRGRIPTGARRTCATR